MVAQKCTMVSVSFDDAAVAEFFDVQIDAGRRPQEFGRIWIHTHPGASAKPSDVDEETFARVFGGCDWAVMFILSREGRTYGRLQFRSGPGGAFKIPIGIDFDHVFSETDFDAWGREYDATVKPLSFPMPTTIDADGLVGEDCAGTHYEIFEGLWEPTTV